MFLLFFEIYMKISNIIYCLVSLVCLVAMLIWLSGRYSMLNDLKDSPGIVFALSGLFGVLASELFKIFMENILSKDNKYYNGMRFVFLIAISTGMLSLLVKWCASYFLVSIALLCLVWWVWFAIYQVTQSPEDTDKK